MKNFPVLLFVLVNALTIGIVWFFLGSEGITQYKFALSAPGFLFLVLWGIGETERKLVAVLTPFVLSAVVFIIFSLVMGVVWDHKLIRAYLFSNQALAIIFGLFSLSKKPDISLTKQQALLHIGVTSIFTALAFFLLEGNPYLACLAIGGLGYASCLIFLSFVYGVPALANLRGGSLHSR